MVGEKVCNTRFNHLLLRPCHRTRRILATFPKDERCWLEIATPKTLYIDSATTGSQADVKSGTDKTDVSEALHAAAAVVFFGI